MRKVPFLNYLYYLLIKLNKNSYKDIHMIIMSLVKNLPDIICVCETWLTSMRLFMGKLHGYDLVNKLSNSNQSGGVAFFVRACHSYEVVEGVSFEQCDLLNLKTINILYLVMCTDTQALHLILLKKTFSKF